MQYIRFLTKIKVVTHVIFRTLDLQLFNSVIKAISAWSVLEYYGTSSSESHTLQFQLSTESWNSPLPSNNAIQPSECGSAAGVPASAVDDLHVHAVYF